MPLHVPPLFKLPAALDCLREDMLAVPVADIARPRRLYVARRANLRKLVNEPEICRLVANYGFEVVCPDDLSIGEQATLFNQAEAILGVKGAAMANIVFADVDCRVMLMSPSSFTDPFYWDIASTRGMLYAEIFGDVTTDRIILSHNDFRLNAADVDTMIQAMLGSQPVV
jgi:capsular polysaccharide biosynthesis protein